MKTTIDLFNYYASKLNNDNVNINIKLVTPEEFKINCKNCGSGCTYFDDLIFNRVNIFIDESIIDEMKLRVLFHEYGHAVYKLSLGKEKEKKLMQEDVNKWEEENEYAAFENQIKEIKRIIDLGEAEDNELFNKMMITLNERRIKVDEKVNYKNALNKLYNETIWTNHRKSFE